jgi:hypothetical protein
VWDEVGVQLIRDLPRPVAKPELYVLEAAILFLDDPIRHGVAKGVGGHVLILSAVTQ